MGDNVANLFQPQLVKIKESLMELEDVDYNLHVKWIRASLCDGEDEKSQELETSLKAGQEFEGKNKERREKGHKKAIQIRAQVENVVHALHRVDAMRTRLPEIVGFG